MRISPHVYNDEADVDRFVEVFRKLAGLRPVKRVRDGVSSPS
jgi:hypothetical protein